jgi:hypothetical protein
MRNCNWLVEVAAQDRKALKELGVPAWLVNAMDHKTVMNELKARGYQWPKKGRK